MALADRVDFKTDERMGIMKDNRWLEQKNKELKQEVEDLKKCNISLQQEIDWAEETNETLGKDLDSIQEQFDSIRDEASTLAVMYLEASNYNVKTAEYKERLDAFFMKWGR